MLLLFHRAALLPSIALDMFVARGCLARMNAPSLGH